MPADRLAKLRGAAAGIIQKNAAVLAITASSPKERRDEDWLTTGGAVLEGQKAAMTRAGEGMLHGAPPAVRGLAKGVLRAPGLLLDAAEIARAKDKRRSLIVAGAGLAGGALGDVLGLPGAAAGYAGARKYAGYMYDNPEARRRAFETNYDATTPIW